MPKYRPNSGERLHLVAGEPAGQGTDPARRGHQRRRLAGDGLGVAVLAPAHLEGRVHLGHLTLAQLTEGGGQQGGDLGAQSGGDLGRSGQQEVAGHDGHQVAEPGVDALHVPTDGGLVHHVVVVEGGQMDQLDRHRPQEVLPGGRSRDPDVAVARARTGRSRFPPAASRWVVTSSRKPSPVTTDSTSRGSRRCSCSSSAGSPRSSTTFTSYRR